MIDTSHQELVKRVAEATPDYPESIAQSHIGVGRSDELGFQGHFLAPPDPAHGSWDPAVDPQEISAGREGIQLTLFCPTWAVVGECEDGHHFAKGCICNRPWCRGCGGNGGQAHQRRKAAWLPKARQIRQMGKFVFTLPPEVRDRYRDFGELAALGVSLKRSLQGHGFERGLRNWHFFGEDHSGSDAEHPGARVGQMAHSVSVAGPVYHPHLEAIVEAGRLRPEQLQAIKQSVATILGVGLERVNVHYQYTRSHRKMLHMVNYALRPTFECWEWDEELAYNLVGAKFKNALTWGEWHEKVWDEDKGKYVNGDYLVPAWEVPAGEDHGRVLEALEHGHCPVDGMPIRWGELVSARILLAPWWDDVGGGYWSWTGLAADV